MKSAILSGYACASIESRTADRAAGDTEAVHGETIRRRRLIKKQLIATWSVLYVNQSARASRLFRARRTRSSHFVVARFGSVASLAMNPEYDYLFKLLVRSMRSSRCSREYEREDLAFVSSVEI